MRVLCRLYHCARQCQSSSFYDYYFFFFRFPIAFACIVLHNIVFVHDNAILCVRFLLLGNRCQNSYARRNSQKPIRCQMDASTRRNVVRRSRHIVTDNRSTLLVALCELYLRLPVWVVRPSSNWTQSIEYFFQAPVKNKSALNNNNNV